MSALTPTPRNREWRSLDRATKVLRADHLWTSESRCGAHWTLMLCDCTCGANVKPGSVRTPLEIRTRGVANGVLVLKGAK